MALPIEDYALIGDCHTAALVGRDGSIDWLCFPRFDSGACFAALLGGPEHGRWLLAPTGKVLKSRRQYRDGTLILETEFETNEGIVRIVDCMPLSNDRWDVVRIVEGVRGRVAMRFELVIRFDYGSTMPWVRRLDDTLLATAGPDRLELRTAIAVHGEEMKTVADFDVSQGERVALTLTYSRSYDVIQPGIDPELALAATEREWREWSQRCTYQGRWRQARDAIHAQVCTEGFDAHRNTFVQSYGSSQLDASLLLIAQVGFLPPEDSRVRGTVEAIERNLTVDGLLLRYSTASDVDALPAGEGAFLPCSFWLADALVLTGRRQEAESLFERLLALANDLGLLAEEYNPRKRRMLGNFPQALTHMALINTARLLSIPDQQVKHSTDKGERPAAVAH